eukprot:SAG11_NODE_3427_length_2454_cov_9.902335_2_plen_84_part_00
MCFLGSFQSPTPIRPDGGARPYVNRRCFLGGAARQLWTSGCGEYELRSGDTFNVGRSRVVFEADADALDSVRETAYGQALPFV